jgi:dynein heavy chain
MRAVKSIILAAGKRKVECPEEDEAYLAYRSIAESSIPKLIAEDVPLFVAILSDLFPSTEQRQPDYAALLEQLRIAC